MFVGKELVSPQTSLCMLPWGPTGSQGSLREKVKGMAAQNGGSVSFGQCLEETESFTKPPHPACRRHNAGPAFLSEE